MSMSFGNQGTDNANAILMAQLNQHWNEIEGSYQEKIISMIKMAKEHWLVQGQKNQAFCVLGVTYEQISKDDKELADSLIKLVKIKFNPQSLFDLANKDEEELEEYVKLVTKAKGILPENWNELWS